MKPTLTHRLPGALQALAVRILTAASDSGRAIFYNAPDRTG